MGGTDWLRPGLGPCARGCAEACGPGVLPRCPRSFPAHGLPLCLSGVSLCCATLQWLLAENATVHVVRARALSSVEGVAPDGADLRLVVREASRGRLCRFREGRSAQRQLFSAGSPSVSGWLQRNRSVGPPCRGVRGHWSLGHGCARASPATAYTWNSAGARGPDRSQLLSPRWPGGQAGHGNHLPGTLAVRSSHQPLVPSSPTHLPPLDPGRQPGSHLPGAYVQCRRRRAALVARTRPPGGGWKRPWPQGAARCVAFYSHDPARVCVGCLGLDCGAWRWPCGWRAAGPSALWGPHLRDQGKSCYGGPVWRPRPRRLAVCSVWRVSPLPRLSLALLVSSSAQGS